MDLHELKPGQRVRVRQTIDRREGDWRSEVVGTVVEVAMRPTGSWFAHGHDNKFWLHRIVLQKPNGELSTLTVDQWTRIEPLDGADSPAASPQQAPPPQ